METRWKAFIDLFLVFIRPAVNSGHRVFSAVLWLTLSLLFAYNSAVMTRLDRWPVAHVLAFEPKNLAAFNGLLFAFFASRSCYEVASAAGLISLPSVELANDGDLNVRNWGMLMLWEWLPTALLLVGVVSRRLRPVCVRSPSYGVFGNIRERSQARNISETQGQERQKRWSNGHGGALFEDPSRYDSDEEERVGSFISLSSTPAS